LARQKFGERFRCRRACLVCAHKQPYQNWLANFLAQDLVVHELPKFWQESVKKVKRIFGMTNILVG
jgi:hypothetical protein